MTERVDLEELRPQPGATCRDQVGLRCIVVAITAKHVFWRCTHPDISTTGRVTHAAFDARFELLREPR